MTRNFDDRCQDSVLQREPSHSRKVTGVKITHSRSRSAVMETQDGGPHNWNESTLNPLRRSIAGQICCWQPLVILLAELCIEFVAIKMLTLGSSGSVKNSLLLGSPCPLPLGTLHAYSWVSHAIVCSMPLEKISVQNSRGCCLDTIVGIMTQKRSSILFVSELCCGRFFVVLALGH